MSARRRLGRLLAGAATVAAVAVLVVPPATAQEENAPEESVGGIETTRWIGSFDDEEVNKGAATSTAAQFSITGTFRYRGDPTFPDNRSLRSVTTNPTGPCQVVVDSSTDTEVNYRERKFAFTMTSPCNQVVRITATATTTRSTNLIGPARTARMFADITFAVPVTPVSTLDASVPDLDSREVTVTWEEPEGNGADATYTVQRLDPETEEWTDVGSDTEIVDEVDDAGVYEYRVMANRPNVDAAFSDPVEVYVGIEPPTTTVPDEDDDESETPTTVTMPDSEAPITVPGNSSTTGGRRVSSHTTVTAAPRVTVTTIDTGFEETLDYNLDDIEPGELAAEGQSILSSESDSGLIGPGAIGASVLVMVGWAGHYLYFRRLAAQF